MHPVDVGNRHRKGRQPNPRLVKIHRSYTVEEAARHLAVHKNTVRNWIKQGLPTCDDRKPMLILGRELAAFLDARRKKNKRPCGVGEIYCVRCRVPRVPAGQMADYQPLSPTSGNLVGLCPVCEAWMYRRTNPAKLDRIRGVLDVTITQAARHVNESPEPSVECDFAQETQT